MARFDASVICSPIVGPSEYDDDDVWDMGSDDDVVVVGSVVRFVVVSEYCCWCDIFRASAGGGCFAIDDVARNRKNDRDRKPRVVV
jgi:hypothetical protein